MATNYPLVRLTSGSAVYYARTFNWSSTGVQTGSTPVTTQFALPAGLPFATYSLSVIANGIASNPVAFTPPVYADTRWAGMSNGSSVTDVDPVLAGNQAGIVGANAFGTVAAAMAVAPAGGVVIVNGNDGTGSGSFSESVAVTKPLNLYLQGGAVSFGSLGGNVAGATISLNGVALSAGSNDTSTEYDGIMTGTGGLTKTGMGTMTLSGANTYSGGTTISGGILQIGNAAATGSIAGAVTDNATLAFDRSDATFVFGGAVSGTGAVINEGSVTLIGVISGDESVSQKSGGVLTLSAPNTYTGPTAVNGGTLLANGSLAAGSAVSVAAGATLAGAGSVGATTVDGTLAPGNSVGILTTGSLTLNSDGTFAESIDGPNAGTDYSQVVASGPVNVTGAAFAPIVGNGFVPAANSAPFEVLVNDSGSPIVGNFAGLPEGAPVSLGGQNFTISYLGGGSGNDIVLTPAAAAPPTVATVQVGDGTAERSEVRSIAVTFSGPVTFTGGDANAAAAFELTHVEDSTDINNLAAAVSTNVAGDTVVTLTFSTTGNAATEIDPVSAQNPQNLSPAPLPSLADGRYSLTILSANVSGAGGGLAGGGPGGNYVSPTDTLGGGAGELQLYRLFGDADGDGIVDQVDLGQFRSTFNANASNPNYLAYLDADNSGVVDQIDLGQLRSRFNTNVF